MSPNTRWLEALVRDVPPPPLALHDLPVDALPAGIGPLPADYLDLCRMYGSGLFISQEHGDVVRLLNPWSSAYVSVRDAWLARFRQFREWEGDDWIPYPVHPEDAGVLPWGDGDTRNYFLWRTEGEPSSWTTVVCGGLEDFVPFNMGTCEFLAALFNGGIPASLLGFVLPDDKFSPQDVVFESRVVPLE